MSAELTPSVDQARAAARAGEWPRVKELLDGISGLDGNAEGALLLAEALLRTGDAERARAWLAARMPLLEHAGGAALRKGVTMLGAAQRALGALQEAERSWNRAVELAHAANDPLALARATNNLGIVANMRGDRRAALGQYQLAIPAYQRLGNAAGLAESYHNMAITYRDERDLERAEECERRAIEFAVAAPNPWLAAAARLGRAEITFRRGDAPLTAAVAGRVAEEFAALADPVAEADATRLRGLAELAAGRVRQASQALERALATALEYANTPLTAECHRARAELRFALGDLAGARSDVARAMTLFEQIGARSDAAEALEWAASRDLAPST